jgi:hypothetical protein
VFLRFRLQSNSRRSSCQARYKLREHASKTIRGISARVDRPIPFLTLKRSRSTWRGLEIGASQHYHLRIESVHLLPSRFDLTGSIPPQAAGHYRSPAHLLPRRAFFAALGQAAGAEAFRSFHLSPITLRHFIFQKGELRGLEARFQAARQVAGEEILAFKRLALPRGYACDQRCCNRRRLAAGICGATVP